MRESIGSTWLTGIIITFIAIFSGFLAYSISYTKAFRVENQIINIIEQKEGFSEFKSSNSNVVIRNASEADLKADSSAEGEIFKYVKALGYNYTMFDNGSNPCKEGKLKDGGYCLVKYCYKNGDTVKTHYKVTTYISLSIPVINVGINIPISGETKSIYYDNSNYKCDVE